jgi:two-component system, sensor histidine kinase PdtaS
VNWSEVYWNYQLSKCALPINRSKLPGYSKAKTFYLRTQILKSSMRLIPETDFSNYYESARFQLTWRINLFLAVILPILALSLYLFEQLAIWPTLIGWVTTLGILVTMRYTKQYKTASVIFTLLGIGLCSSTLLGIPEAFHLVDTLWMMIIILYAYFTLGKTWGNFTLIANSTTLVIFILWYVNDSLLSVAAFKQGERVSLALNAIMCSLIIGYLIQQFLKTTRFAEEQYQQKTSELQDKNKEVESQNEEKTVMLREIHHRVKNNLQVITSLLRLQAREARDPRTIELFKDSTNRVVAMALIHDKMYQTKDLAKINLEDYLRTLLQDLIHSYAVEVPIKAEIESHVEKISNKSLVPLALLFNELVSNSLKHAFNTQEDGRIRIIINRDAIHNNGTGKIVLNYWDNGIWREKQKDTSFGLELIESLTEQMDGSYSRQISQGTAYEFILPDNL